MPAIFNWPGVIRAGAECHEVTGGMDLFTTFATVAGAAIPGDRPIDGKDLMPLLRGTPEVKSPHEAFFSYSGARLGGVRKGKWKLSLPPNQEPKLYDLDQDIARAPRCFRLLSGGDEGNAGTRGGRQKIRGEVSGTSSRRLYRLQTGPE